MRFASLIENPQVRFGRGVSDSISPQLHTDGSEIGSSPSLVSSPRVVESLESQSIDPFHPALRIDAQSLPQGCRCWVYARPVRLSLGCEVQGVLIRPLSCLGSCEPR